MSIKIMTEIWASGPEKQGDLLVLLAIADFADDDGFAWPSMAKIAQKSRMLERSAQRVVRRLEVEGWLQIDTGNGRHGCNRYRVNPVPRTPVLKTPRPKDTPSFDTETPSLDTETPSRGTPEPSRTIKEPSIPPLSPIDILSQGIRRETAEDFASHRKAMRKPLTSEAAKRLLAKVSDHPDPDAVFDESIANGWQGIFPEKTKSQNGGRNERRHQGHAVNREIAARFANGTIKHDPYQ